MAKIGIFPGSFNPVHKGHLKLIKYSLKNLKLDYLYLVPCYKSVNKLDHFYISAKQRTTALKLAKPFKKVFISLWELNQNKPILTYKTIEHFKSIHLNDELFLLLGSDYQKSFFSWEGNDSIQKKVKLVFFNRSSQPFDQKNKSTNNIFVINPFWNYSSTKYRNGHKNQVPLRIYLYFLSCNFFKKLNHIFKKI